MVSVKNLSDVLSICGGWKHHRDEVTHGERFRYLAERLGSGDGEREAAMTRQMPFEPLPASVLFGPVVIDDFIAFGTFPHEVFLW